MPNIAQTSVPNNSQSDKICVTWEIILRDSWGDILRVLLTKYRSPKIRQSKQIRCGRSSGQSRCPTFNFLRQPKIGRIVIVVVLFLLGLESAHARHIN